MRFKPSFFNSDPHAPLTGRPQVRAGEAVGEGIATPVASQGTRRPRRHTPPAGGLTHHPLVILDIVSACSCVCLRVLAWMLFWSVWVCSLSVCFCFCLCGVVCLSVVCVFRSLYACRCVSRIPWGCLCVCESSVYKL